MEVFPELFFESTKPRLALEALCYYRLWIFFFLFFAIKAPGGHQLLLYSAFWFFLKADYETLHYFSYCPFLAIIKRRTPFFYFSKSRSWFMGDQQVFSSFIPPNKRVLFFNQNHTMLSTFHSKNMRFLKFWLKILRVSWCQGVDF